MAQDDTKHRERTRRYLGVWACVMELTFNDSFSVDDRKKKCSRREKKNYFDIVG